MQRKRDVIQSTNKHFREMEEIERMSEKAGRVFCSKCNEVLWKVSIKPKEKDIYLTCAKCGKTQVIKPPSAKEILERSPEVVKEYVKRAIQEEF